MTSPNYTLIPFESGLGAQLAATADGPVALHESGLLEKLRNNHIAADWDKAPARTGHGVAVPALGTQERRDLVLDAVTRHRDRVEKAFGNGHYPVALGGDHAMAMGTISALANAKQAHGETGVLWIDAHLDAHTHATSPSKAIHGMPLAHLLGYGDNAFIALGTETPVIRPEHLAIVAAQSWEPEEYELLKSLGVRIYSMPEVEERGLETVLAEACERINDGTRVTAMSLDIDVLDPAETPGFGSHEPGGLSVSQLYDGLCWLAAHQKFDVIEMVEYNPERDDTGANTAQVIEQALSILLSRDGVVQQSA